MGIWRTTIPEGAIRNGNISLTNCPFDLSDFIGGSNESERPAKLLRICFDKVGPVEMWVYGKGKNGSPKNILTNKGRNHVKSFFEANGIDDTKPVSIQINEVSHGELIIRKA